MGPKVTSLIWVRGKPTKYRFSQALQGNARFGDLTPGCWGKSRGRERPISGLIHRNTLHHVRDKSDVTTPLSAESTIKTLKNVYWINHYRPPRIFSGFPSSGCGPYSIWLSWHDQDAGPTTFSYFSLFTCNRAYIIVVHTEGSKSNIPCCALLARRVRATLSDSRMWRCGANPAWMTRKIRVGLHPYDVRHVYSPRTSCKCCAQGEGCHTFQQFIVSNHFSKAKHKSWFPNHERSWFVKPWSLIDWFICAVE
jgi:hypothetical protein